jgi:uncharacterized protein YndB with AHSA1/START domain
LQEPKPILIHVERTVPVSPEEAFDAWLNPDIARRFFFATDTGEMVTAEIDPQVGGKFLMVDRRNGEDAAHAGVYDEIDRPRQIAFTFSVPPDSPEKTRIILDFLPQNGGCLVSLTHELHPNWASQEEKVRNGWKAMLEKLYTTLQEPGR